MEFAPARVPASLRLVRGAGPDDWLPVTTLRRVRLTHKVVEPYQGDHKSAVSTLAWNSSCGTSGRGSSFRSAVTRSGSRTR
ncbi:hypothetical protein [Streptomyces sp. WAC07061]|uniref:hypothetical protein n=1 Tax=Streptomyces sp. WAC07061 TaxID=2487410 RepID=UPI0021AEB94E|nr:hypothetical protein [Streptomyces sp. WAC07061]